MDYRGIRAALQALRVERKMGVPELAEEASLAKTTVYRLEDLAEDPDREIDLATLEKLVSALGLTLSEFFARLEGAEEPTDVIETAIPSDIQGIASKFLEAVDRLVTARVGAAPTTRVEAGGDGTLTVTPSVPLQDWQIDSVREHVEMLASGKSPAPAASNTRSRRAPGERPRRRRA